MKDECTKSLVKPQGQGSMIAKMQGVHLIRVGFIPDTSSRNEQTRYEQGNACVQ
jgi:hypothetical protein